MLEKPRICCCCCCNFSLSQASGQATGQWPKTSRRSRHYILNKFHAYQISWGSDFISFWNIALCNFFVTAYFKGRRKLHLTNNVHFLRQWPLKRKSLIFGKITLKFNPLHYTLHWAWVIQRLMRGKRFESKIDRTRSDPRGLYKTHHCIPY